MAQNQAYDPFGVNHLKATERQPLVQIDQGDELVLSFASVTYEGAPATPHNCLIHFTLKNDRFDNVVPTTTGFGSPVPFLIPSDEFNRGVIWLGVWGDGVEETETPGFLKVTLPQRITSVLRRGAFIYSLDTCDKLGDHRQTFDEGTIQVEYSANAPQPDVPYRRADWNYILGRLP